MGHGFRSPSSSILFYGILIAAQIMSFSAFIILLRFLIHYRGGFAWRSNISKEFNLHPFFMALGLVFLYGDAMIVYRLLERVPKKIVKIIHAVLLLSSLIFSIIGLVAVLDNHNYATPKKANFYSLHSWIGLGTMILFGLQWIFGFTLFLFPKASESIRRTMLPVHKFFGKAIFCLAIGSLLMGITEYNIFFGLYSDPTVLTQRNLMNSFGLLAVVFGGLVLYLVDNTEFQRKSDESNSYMVQD